MSDPSVVVFRALLVVSVAAGLIGGLIDNVFPSLLPESLAQAIEGLPPPPTLALFGASALFLVTFGGMVTAVLGLYFFQPWARQLAVWMTVLGLLFHPLLGPSIQSGWAQLLLEASSVLWGVVLAMSFVSSLSSRFAARERPDF